MAARTQEPPSRHATSGTALFVARLRAALGTEAAALRQAFAALLVSSGGDLLAGVTLAGITGGSRSCPA
ncbi:MAG: hypothetical protein R2699_04625 [Acidimicrobiales bacterium]